MLSYNALIALGSNLSDPALQLEKSLSLLATQEGITLKAVSDFFTTKPVGYLNQPDFINAVCWVETTLSAQALLEKLLAIESDMGRTRDSEIRFGPRIIDLDLLAYETEKVKTERLTLPHPRMHQRLFVLEPMVNLLDKHPELAEWFNCLLSPSPEFHLQRLLKTEKSGSYTAQPQLTS